MSCISQRLMMLQGDMIPWTISQQYQDTESPRLSGARVVRIAAHPDMMRAGYGTRALELLRRYYEGDLADLVRPQSMLIMPCDSAQTESWGSSDRRRRQSWLSWQEPKSWLSQGCCASFRLSSSLVPQLIGQDQT